MRKGATSATNLHQSRLLVLNASGGANLQDFMAHQKVRRNERCSFHCFYVVQSKYSIERCNFTVLRRLQKDEKDGKIPVQLTPPQYGHLARVAW